MFCQVSDVASFLQIEIREMDFSALQAIRDATAVIKAYCKQEIALVRDDVEVFCGGYGSKLYLSQVPVLSVASIVVDGVSLVDGVDYKTNRKKGVVHRLKGQVWPDGVENIEVIYTHGYEPLPDVARVVCMRIAARVYQAGKRSAETGGVPGVSQTTLGDFSVSYGAETSTNDSGKGVSAAAKTLLVSEKELLDTLRYTTL